VATTTPQVFSGQFARLAEKARAAGVAINGNNGRASRMGVEVEWNYSEQRQELSLACLHTPFFMSTHDVNEKLHALVKETLTA
jgi:hypothetical protein